MIKNIAAQPFSSVIGAPAAKGVKPIKKLSQSPKAEVKPAVLPVVAPFIDETLVEKTQPKRRAEQSANVFIVTANDKKRAKEYINEALDYQSAGNPARSMRSLMRALQVNPELRTDNYFLSLVSAVVERDEDEAISLLLDQTASKTFVREVQQGQRELRKLSHEVGANKLSWKPAILDLWLHCIILTVGLILTAFVLVQSLPAIIPLAAADNSAAIALTEYGTTIGMMGTTTLIFYAVLGGIASTFALLLQNIGIHFAAGFLGGRGTLRFLMERTLSLYNKFIIIALLAVNLVVFLTANDLGMIGLLPLAAIAIGILVVFMKATGHIGQAFDFGAARGMLAWLCGFAVAAILMGTLGLVVNAVR